jgi:ABC-2 type transport system ATP-binding protein
VGRPARGQGIIGVVPAEARLFERLSGEELLEYAGRLRGLPAGEARSRAAQLLDVLDLAGDAKRLVADYSTGMRKKAALGCALIHNPSVLFLDEPLEGVDPVSADVIRRLLTRFVGSGSTVLFSSHVMELVEQVCDHVSIIDKGRIVATGTTDEVRGGKTLQQAFIDLVGSRATTGRDCHGSAPRPAEAAAAAQRAALVQAGQGLLHPQHGLRRAGRDRHLRRPGRAARPRTRRWT